MEVRIIKTCHGLQELMFLDGALVSPDVNLLETERIEMVEFLTVQDWLRRFVPIKLIPVRME